MISSAACLAIAQPILAQPSLSQERKTGTPPQTINILVAPSDGGADPLAKQKCEKEREGAIITGEIIVCGKRGRAATDGAWHRQRWERKYARETAYINDPQAPDVAGGGIFRGQPSASGLCILNKCPDPPALLIDVEALPPPPENSDAARIASGLTPRGHDGERGAHYSEEELGLPPRPSWSEESSNAAPER